MQNLETMKYYQIRFTPGSSQQVYMSYDNIDWSYSGTLYYPNGFFSVGPDSVGIGGDVYTGFSNDSTARTGWNIVHWELG
jgi:hypothetical protein